MTSTRTKNRFLIDTHVFLWAVDSIEKLSDRALEILQDRSSEIYLSRASYWEICLKISKGKLRLAKGWERVLERERKKNRFQWLELTSSHCEGIIALPDHHRDPFDRLLVAQAVCEGASLVSCDDKLAQYDLDVVW